MYKKIEILKKIIPKTVSDWFVFLGLFYLFFDDYKHDTLGSVYWWFRLVVALAVVATIFIVNLRTLRRDVNRPIRIIVVVIGMLFAMPWLLFSNSAYRTSIKEENSFKLSAAYKNYCEKYLGRADISFEQKSEVSIVYAQKQFLFEGVTVNYYTPDGKALLYAPTEDDYKKRDELTRAKNKFESDSRTYLISLIAWLGLTAASLGFGVLSPVKEDDSGPEEKSQSDAPQSMPDLAGDSQQSAKKSFSQKISKKLLPQNKIDLFILLGLIFYGIGALGHIGKDLLGSAVFWFIHAVLFAAVTTAIVTGIMSMRKEGFSYRTAKNPASAILVILIMLGITVYFQNLWVYYKEIDKFPLRMRHEYETTFSKNTKPAPPQSKAYARFQYIMGGIIADYTTSDGKVVSYSPTVKDMEHREESMDELETNLQTLTAWLIYWVILLVTSLVLGLLWPIKKTSSSPHVG